MYSVLSHRFRLARHTKGGRMRENCYYMRTIPNLLTQLQYSTFTEIFSTMQEIIHK
jgi:hypothetical protein